MTSTRKITRLQAVSNQLDTAYKAYFLWDDLVSAITLAGAAERVMSDMQPQDGIFGVDAYSVRSVINLHIKPEHWKEAASFYRADYDFFRHADKKTEADYSIKEAAVDFWLFIPLLSFLHLKQPTTKAMRAYTHWFFIHHPQVLKEDDGDYNRLILDFGEGIDLLGKQQFYDICTAKDPYP